MAGSGLVRGRVYAAVLQGWEDQGEKYFLVVSNNRRNGAFPQVLAVRTTSTKPKSPRPATVALDHREPLGGWAYCDDIVELYPEDVKRDLGALSRDAMRRVADGLASALGFGE